VNRLELSTKMQKEMEKHLLLMLLKLVIIKCSEKEDYLTSLLLLKPSSSVKLLKEELKELEEHVYLLLDSILIYTSLISSFTSTTTILFLFHIHFLLLILVLFLFLLFLKEVQLTNINYILYS